MKIYLRCHEFLNLIRKGSTEPGRATEILLPEEINIKLGGHKSEERIHTTLDGNRIPDPHLVDITLIRYRLLFRNTHAHTDTHTHIALLTSGAIILLLYSIQFDCPLLQIALSIVLHEGPLTYSLLVCMF